VQCATDLGTAKAVTPTIRISFTATSIINGCLLQRSEVSLKEGKMTTLTDTDLLRRRIDPYWRKARIAARLLLKKEDGQPWSARDRRLATLLSDDPGVPN